MNNLKYYFYYLDAEFAGYPVIIRVTVTLVVLLGLLYLFSLIRLFSVSRKIKKEEERRNKIKKKYEEKLKTILFSAENLSRDSIVSSLSLRGKKFKKWEKTYITDLIINLIQSK